MLETCASAHIIGDVAFLVPVTSHAGLRGVREEKKGDWVFRWFQT